MTDRRFIPRRATRRLAESIADTPVTLIHGPRQCGKTTLAQTAGAPLGYTYYTFDDPDARAAAQSDPVGFVSDCHDRAILDEVQLVPDIFRMLKLSVDRHRKPGRFILTGSTNMLLVPNLADALTGRMEVVRLHPFSQQEIEQNDSVCFLDRLFAGNFQTRRVDRFAEELADRIVAGGYPAALALPPGPRRSSWFRNYAGSLVQKDVLELSRIRSLEVLPKLLSAAANLSGQLLNTSKLASQLQMNRNTIRDYLTLLERQFLIDLLPPWFNNRMRRLVKTPKIHVGDTGLAAALLRAGADSLRQNRALLGQLLESFVFQELKRQASSSHEPFDFYHFRDRDGLEVDLIIERGAFELAGIEIKAAATVFGSDFKGLRKIRAAHRDRFKFGAVLYDGEICGSFGDGMYAVPIRMLWEAI
ncbi:MAG: ATP-binding protein [Bacteroidota bacterium]|nr:ATP-binding protein [Bacteroidota bacterium]